MIIVIICTYNRRYMAGNQKRIRSGGKLFCARFPLPPPPPPWDVCVRTKTSLLIEILEAGKSQYGVRCIKGPPSHEEYSTTGRFQYIVVVMKKSEIATK